MNRRDVRKALGHRARQVFLLGRRQVNGGEMGLRRLLERSRRKHHGKVDAEPLPVDRAQIGDRGGDFAAEQVYGQRVSDLQAHAAGQTLVKGHQRRALMVGWPPGAGSETRALW